MDHGARYLVDCIEQVIQQVQRQLLPLPPTMSQPLPLFQFLEHPNARPLCRATSRSVGYDLFPVETVTVPLDSTEVIEIGIRVILPPGYYGKIESRSSLASKGVCARGGVIDPDYTGSLKVILENRGRQTFEFRPSRAVAQLVLIPFAVPDNVFTLTSLDRYLARHRRINGDNDRNDNGFGSTDKHNHRCKHCTPQCHS